MLVVGCGNSELSAQLYDAGYHNILSTDYSPTVLAAMQKRYASTHPALRWQIMDMTALTYDDASFDAVVDKGALDALMAEPTPEVERDACAMLQCIARVLKPGGVYLCISLAERHICQRLLRSFRTTGRQPRQPCCCRDFRCRINPFQVYYCYF